MRDLLFQKYMKIFFDSISSIERTFNNVHHNCNWVEIFKSMVQSWKTLNLLSSVPCNIYPPSESEPEGDPEFKTDLVKSMRKSNNYCYMGVDMTIASHCIIKLYENKPYPVINNMLFIISDLNCKIGETSDIKERKNRDRDKLISSIKTTNKICSYTGYKINAVFYILPNRPPLHIHKTDGLCFWGVVDKTGQWECPTTYCYKQNDDKLSMFTTINDLITQTKQRVDDGAYPSRKFIITSWNGSDATPNNVDFNSITYQCNNSKKKHKVTIEEFVKNMKIKENER